VAEVTWTPLALRDLQEIFDFIALDNRDAARQVLSDIREATRHLGEFPRSGRKIQRFKANEVRELIAGNYRVPYAVVGGAVQILRVLHAARLVEGELE